MPDFSTVNRGVSWSSVSGQNKSERVKTGASDRPDVELKLAGRKVEIRTGSRVRRARGPWVAFKHGMTKATKWLPRFLGGLSKAQQTERTLRRSEWKFDRHVNRLVEDLANKPNLSVKDVTKRLNQMSDEAAKIMKHDPNVTKEQLADRFAKNLEESLSALARRKPEAFARVLNAFQSNGVLSDLGNRYTAECSPDKKWMQEGSRHDPVDAPPLTATGALKAGILEVRNPKQHEFGMMLAGKLSTVPQEVREINRQANRDELKHSVTKGTTFTGKIELDLVGDAGLDKELKTLNDLPNEKVGNHEVADRFLRDLTRAQMVLTDSNGSSVDILEELKHRQMKHGQQETHEFSTGMLNDYTDKMGFSGNDREIAIRNLSRLMNQDVVGSLHVPQTKSLFETSGGIGLLNAPQTEKLKYEVSIDKNGDLICRNTKTSTLGTYHTPKLGMRVLDPEKTNDSKEVITLRVRREDLAKEPLKFEVLQADVDYQLDTRGSRKA